MKTLKYFLFLFLVSLAVVSCDERDYDMPTLPVPEYTGDPANITIKELKEKYNTDNLTLIKDSLILEARVIGNDISGNIFKQLFIQDEEGYGIVLSIDATGIAGLYPVGQKIFIHLKDLYIGKYGGEHQIGGDNKGKIGRMSEVTFKDHTFRDGHPIVMEPKVVTIADLAINSDSYVNTLVRIDNVEFVNGGTGVFAPAGANATNQDVKDESDQVMTVRTSQYADFSKNTLPVGSGSIVGVLGRYNNGWQFTLRSASDLVNFGGQGTKGNPYTVSEAIAKGMDGSQGWVKGYIIGSAGLGISETNPIKDASGFILTAPFLKNSVVIAEKADETDWQKYMVIQLPSGTDIEKINLEDHADYKGKEISIGGTLQSVFGRPGIQTNGTSRDYIFDDGSTPEPVGDGTKENPYTVLQAQVTQNSSAAWVKGYIVGAVVENKEVTSITGPGDVVFGTTGIRATAVLIATSADVTDYTKCVIVNLPSGPIRSAINLIDNPGNLGKEVKVNGVLRAYFGIAGVRDLTDYVLGDGGTTPPAGDIVLNAPFSTGFDGFTAVDKLGSQAWTSITNYGGYLLMSGYDNGNFANEDWLVSPAIDLSGASKATLSYSYTISKGKSNLVTQDYMKANQTIWITDTYTGDPSTTTWTQLTNTVYPTGSDWNYVDESITLPASMVGKSNVVIAFKYTSDNTDSASWQLKALTVRK